MNTRNIIDLPDDLVNLLKSDSTFQNEFNNSNNDDSVNYVRPNTIIIERSSEVLSHSPQPQSVKFFANNMTMFGSAEFNDANKHSAFLPDGIVDIELKHHLDIKFAGFK